MLTFDILKQTKTRSQHFLPRLHLEHNFSSAFWSSSIITQSCMILPGLEESPWKLAERLNTTLPSEPQVKERLCPGPLEITENTCSSRSSICLVPCARNIDDYNK